MLLLLNVCLVAPGINLEAFLIPYTILIAFFCAVDTLASLESSPPEPQIEIP